MRLGSILGRLVKEIKENIKGTETHKTTKAFKSKQIKFLPKRSLGINFTYFILS